jgi:hypothetical protein
MPIWANNLTIPGSAGQPGGLGRPGLAATQLVHLRNIIDKIIAKLDEV